MSDQISTAFVKQFNSTVYTLLQQKGAKLRPCVREEPMQSEEQFFEQVGTGSANEVTTRFGDSPVNSQPHDRRRVTLRFFDSGEFIDKFDKVRMLIDPQSVYTQNIVYTLGRCLDDVLLGGADVPRARGRREDEHLVRHRDCDVARARRPVARIRSRRA